MIVSKSELKDLRGAGYKVSVSGPIKVKSHSAFKITDSNYKGFSDAFSMIFGAIGYISKKLNTTCTTYFQHSWISGRFGILVEVECSPYTFYGYGDSIKDAVLEFDKDMCKKLNEEVISEDLRSGDKPKARKGSSRRVGRKSSKGVRSNRLRKR